MSGTLWTRWIPFKVDIAGIIEIMGTSLYSRATTPIRELIQNAHDGINRRRQIDLGFKGRIDIIQDSSRGTLTFIDDGIGLSVDQAEKFLGTLGIGLTGLMKKSAAGGGPSQVDASGLIGQFGIGLFSAFMLAERMVVETRRADLPEDFGVRWDAGAGAEIELSGIRLPRVGTSVTLHLKPQHVPLAVQLKPVEDAVKEYADFLPVPIFINHAPARTNLVNAAWFDPTPDRETIELELESLFHETALDLIPIRTETPSPIAGTLYVTPQRTPGFSSEPVVTVTVRRMVISRSIRGLLPEWASFLRGVLELGGCAPTASREDLVRDLAFEQVRQGIEAIIFRHFEDLASTDPARLSAVINWHRYTLAGAAVGSPRLRKLLSRTYPFPTSRGPLTFEKILAASGADPLFEAESARVIWYNIDRKQEQWANTLFASHSVPCVHALRSFEEALLASMTGDANQSRAADGPIALRPASPGSPNFARTILGVRDMEDAPAQWSDFLASTGARIYVATFDERLPVMAFLNERHELMQTFEQLKKTGEIPSGFQRLIDQHFGRGDAPRNEVLLNQRHPLVRSALAESTSHPLASVLRLLVANALSAAGAAINPEIRRLQAHDLDWIAQTMSKRGG